MSRLDELRCKVARTRAQARAIRARAEEARGRNVELVTTNLERQCEALTLIRWQVEVHGELIRTSYALRSIHIPDPTNLRHKADVRGATRGSGPWRTPQRGADSRTGAGDARTLPGRTIRQVAQASGAG